MYKLKRVCVVVMSLVVLVTLTACGKGAEGQLKGKSFELVEESGDVLGDITFEDNGEYRVKDKDPFGGEGVGKYEVVSKGDKDYLVFNSVPDNAGEFLEDTLSYNGSTMWMLNNMKLISIDSTIDKDLPLKEYKQNELEKQYSDMEYDYMLKTIK